MKLSMVCIAASLLMWQAQKVQATIYGTMSNFDIYNETPHDSYGAEIELEVLCRKPNHTGES